MTEDITSLQIKILYDSVEKAEARLKKLETTGNKTKKSVEGFGKGISSSLKSLVGLGAGVVGVTAAIAGLRAIIKTTAEFQKLNAQLETATGSAENAALAFDFVKEFATKTPYDLQQATGAFIQMVSTGLLPTEKALTSFGNTASALGRTLGEMVEAVSKATAGEFEPLRKFYITAKKDGDNVAFTFRGVSTTIKNNAKDIQDYFTKLGENNFAGAMEKQMKTLGGAISNLEDAWDVMKNEIGNAGLGEVVGEGLRNATALVGEFTAEIASGQVQAGFDSWGVAFESYVQATEQGFSYLNNLFVDHGKVGQDTGMTLSEGLIGGMKAVVAAYPAYVETAATILWGIVDSAVAVGKAIYQTIAASFNSLLSAAANTGVAIGNALNPFSGKSTAQGFADAFSNVESDISNAAIDTRIAWNQSMAKIGINADTVAGNVAKSWEDAGERIDRAAMLTAEADQKREKYDDAAPQRAKDRATKMAAMLEEMRKKQAAIIAAQGSTAKPKKGGGRSPEESEWNSLEKSLLKEEGFIEESYNRRLALIENNTLEGSQYQAELELTLTEKFQEEQMKRVDLLKEMPEKMFEAYALEEQIIEDSYARRKDIILNATELTEAERLKMLEEAELQYTATMRKHETEKNKTQLGLIADFFGNISTMASAFGKKGAKIAKAAAIAETTVKTYQSATSAYAALAGIAYIGPALGAAAAGAAIATGMANVQKIKATDDSGGYSGAYAIGGLIPAGKFGLVGEAGPELVSGPAMVTSAQSTKDRYGSGGGSSAGPNVEVKIINMTGEKVTKRESHDGDKEMIEFVIGQASNRVGEDIRKGGTGVAKAIESIYNLGRGKRA